MGLVLGSGNPLRHTAGAYVNRALILMCVLAFVSGLPPEPFAFVPAYLFGTVDLAGPLPAADPWRGLFGHVFVHSDALHLVSNMVALWVFGDNVEDAMGHLRYVAFFFLCAACGAITEGLVTSEPMVPLVGASGAICGVMGAYLLLHPRAKILLLLFYRVPVLLPASLVVGADLVVNVVFAVFPLPPEVGLGEVAWGAHLGGFATGMALIAPFKRASVPLFHPPSAYPRVPFPRLQRVVIDFFPPPSPDGRRASALDRVVVTTKAALYLALVLVLLSTL